MNPPQKETSDSTDDSVNVETKKRKKHKRKEKKNKKKKRKHQASDSEPENHKKSKHKKHKRSKKSTKKDTHVEDDEPGPSVPSDLLAETSKARTPMTKEEWEKSQNVIRRVYDETGRSRLIKGDGEILEEIVSKEKHREINRQATLGDGLYFQSKLQGAKK